MSSLAATIPQMEPLVGNLPASASDYYAIADADLDRISSNIYCIKDALVTIDYTLPYQFRFSIAESDGNWFTEIRQFDEIQPDSEEFFIDERVGFLEDRFSKFNVCHFLFDKLGRTVEFDQLSIDSYFLFTNHSYFSDVFSMMGLKQTPLATTDRKIVTYRIKELYLSSSTFFFRHPAFNFRPKVMELLSKLKRSCLVGDPVQLESKRIYVDRNTVSARDVINKNVLESILKEFGFTTVIFEDYTLRQQASIVNNSDLMLGVHGAGLTNALFFGSDQFKLLEILPPLCASSDYWKLASAFGLSYDAYVANDVEFPRPDYSQWNHNSQYNRRDVLIDENEFRRFLEINI